MQRANVSMPRCSFGAACENLPLAQRSWLLREPCSLAVWPDSGPPQQSLMKTLPQSTLGTSSCIHLCEHLELGERFSRMGAQFSTGKFLSNREPSSRSESFG